jgi:hypothetical protein
MLLDIKGLNLRRKSELAEGEDLTGPIKIF